MPETATGWRSVVCLAPFIYPTSAGLRSLRPHPQGPRGAIFLPSSQPPLSLGGIPQRLEKSLSPLKLRLSVGGLQLTLSYRLLLFFAAIAGPQAAASPEFPGHNGGQGRSHCFPGAFAGQAVENTCLIKPLA